MKAKVENEKHYRVPAVAQLIQLNVNSPDATKYNGAPVNKKRDDSA